MNYKRLLFASMIVLTGTGLLFIQNLPTSNDFPKEEGSLSVMRTTEEELDGQVQLVETSPMTQKILYRIYYVIETDRLKKNISILHQLAAPIIIEDSSLPTECSYDGELTITCTYQENAYYVAKEIPMTLAYNSEMIEEPLTSKVLAYTSYENKKSEGKEQWFEVLTNKE